MNDSNKCMSDPMTLLLDEQLVSMDDKSQIVMRRMIKDVKTKMRMT